MRPDGEEPDGAHACGDGRAPRTRVKLPFTGGRLSLAVAFKGLKQFQDCVDVTAP